MGHSFQHEVMIHFLKCVDISIIGVYYLVLSFIFAVLLNTLFHEEKEDTPYVQSSLWLFLKICLQTVLLMLTVYAIRKIVKAIPFVFDGYNGYDHRRLRELNGAVILAFVLITLQSNYGNDLQLLASRFKTAVSSAPLRM